MVVPAVLAVLGAGAAPASADVEIGAERVVVSTPGASVTATRAPLRLSFADGAGRTVLEQVPNSAQAPVVTPPTPDPVPLGAEPPDRPVLYAPLTFTVGTGRQVQYPGTQYAGNELTGAEGGAQFSAREVVAVERRGDGVELTVATSDPSGRRLVVTLTPAPGGGAIRVAARVTPDGGVVSLADTFTSASGEAFRGFGGRHDELDQRGSDFYNWNQQQNTSYGSLQPVADGTAPVTGGQTALFPGGPEAAYYTQSLFVSSRRYGFLLDRDELSRWRMASDRPDAWRVDVAAPAIDYVVAPGDAPAAIATVTGLSGRHRVPPAWALGPIMDRLVRFPPESADAYKRSVEDDLRRLERGEVRLSAYRIEGWYLYAPDELRAIIARLQRLGTKAMLYFRAFVESEANGYDDPDAFREAIDGGYVATTEGGAPYLYTTNYNVPGALIDFTDPEARRWWEGRIRAGLDLGADGFMQDFGESTQVDMRFHDGSTGAQMHNRYGKVYHALTRGIVERYERENPGREVFFYVRTGYSGTPGSAAAEGGNFAGDGTTDFSRASGLASQTPDMLNRAAGGLFGFTTDIGGYFDVGPYTPTTKELFVRWAQWAVFSPLFRVHGSVGAGTHAPWTYDEETVRIYNGLARLRAAAQPLVLRLWREGARTGMPPTRPLWLAFPGDEQAARQDQQWMLGDDLLVAPVVEQGATSRDVYFPAGCWEHGETGERFTGPRTARVAAPLTSLPHFARCGSAPVPAAAGAAGLPAPRRCVSRRSFTIRLRRPDGARLRSARVTVDGRPVRVVRRGGRLAARVDLRGRARGRVVVRATVVTRSGQRSTETRRYRTCAPRRG
jgi:alpha-glucosidase (family GH31 glycosyl hydrolase)